MSDAASTLKTELLAALGLDDTTTIEALATALDCTPRTIYRMRLPFIVVAGKRRIPLSLARELMRSRVQTGDPPPPRTPGRPKKHIA